MDVRAFLSLNPPKGTVPTAMAVAGALCGWCPNLLPTMIGQSKPLISQSTNIHRCGPLRFSLNSNPCNNRKECRERCVRNPEYRVNGMQLEHGTRSNVRRTTRLPRSESSSGRTSAEPGLARKNSLKTCGSASAPTRTRASRPASTCSPLHAPWLPRTAVYGPCLPRTAWQARPLTSF